MSLSDQFCVVRHKKSFFDLVNNKLDITFANEQEILSLIDAKNFDEVISFAQQLGKLIVITRSDKGSIAIQKNEVVECDSQKNLRIVDLSGAGDLFAAGFLHGHVNNLSLKAFKISDLICSILSFSNSSRFSNETLSLFLNKNFQAFHASSLSNNLPSLASNPS